MTTANLYKEEVLKEFIQQIFTHPVEQGSISTDIGDFATFTFKKPYDQEDLLSKKMSVQSNPIKIYGTEHLEEENYFEDGVKYYSLFDFLKRQWIIVNIATREEVMCLGQFGFAQEGDGVTTVTTNAPYSIRTWQQLKDFDWKKYGGRR